jgi:hypothetical protein
LAAIATLPSALCLMGKPPCSMMVLAPAQKQTKPLQNRNTVHNEQLQCK